MQEQLVQDNSYQRKVEKTEPILLWEKGLVDSSSFTHHLRKIKSSNRRVENQIIVEYHVKRETIQGLENLIVYLKNKQLDQIDFPQLLAQFLEGLYQLHQLNIVARSLILSKLDVKVEQNNNNNFTLIFSQYGYFYGIEQTPENQMKKLPTFETDLWLVGSLLLKILIELKICDQNLLNQLFLNNLIENIFDQNQIIRLSQDNAPQEFIEFIGYLNQILKYNAFQRISFYELLQVKKIQAYLIGNGHYNEMCNFYQNYSLKALLKQWKTSKKRDHSSNSEKQKLYYYEIQSPFIKFYYQNYIEIMLLNFAFHFSFHFPTKNIEDQMLVNQLIIQKIWILSKQLKLQLQTQTLPLQFQGFFEEDNQATIIDLIKLKKEQEFQHLKLSNLKQTQVTHQNIPVSYYKIDEQINNIRTDQYKTLTSHLVVNILRNSSVTQLNQRKFNSTNLENIFKEELMKREN